MKLKRVDESNVKRSLMKEKKVSEYLNKVKELIHKSE